MTVNNSVPSQTIVQAAKADSLEKAVLAARIEKLESELKEIKGSSDKVETGIKRGIVPTLKGLGAGLVGGTASGALSGIWVASQFGESAGFGASLGGTYGAIAGTITGAVVTNITDNKWGAAVGGAVVGVAATAFMGEFGPGIIVGGISGAVSAFAAAAVTERK